METVRAEICKEEGMISGIEYIPYGPSTSCFIPSRMAFV